MMIRTLPRRTWRFCAQLALAALLALAPGKGIAEPRESFEVTSTHRGQPVKIKVQLFLQNSAAKSPAMIIVHGSRGVSATREHAYAQEYAKLGIASAVIDSFGSRGIAATTRDQDQVSAYDMLADAVSTLLVLARHPAIDANRIGIIGFSKGGTVAIKAALRRYVGPLTKEKARFAVAIAVYPWCGDFPLDMRAANPAVLLLLGADDTYSGVTTCLDYARRVRDLGGSVQVKTYQAKHGWDVPGPAEWSDPQGQNRAKCIYDEISNGRWVERG